MARIQEINLDFMAKKDLADMVAACFRKPKEGEVVKLMNSTQVLQSLHQEYPTLKINHSASIHLGLAMKQMGYERKERNRVAYYQVIPRKAV